MKINPDIVSALEQAIIDNHNRYAFSKKIGVPQQTIARWVNGDGKSISDDIYDRIYPFIEPYLKQAKVFADNYADTLLENKLINDEHYGADVAKDVKAIESFRDDLDNLDKNDPDYITTKNGIECEIEQLEKSVKSKTDDAKIAYESAKINKKNELNMQPINSYRKTSELIPLTKRLQNVPVLSFAQAAGYEPALEPLCDYIKETSDRTEIFFNVPKECFALEVSGDSMAPDYPNGSIALIESGVFPQRGDIVVAKLNTGQVVIKEYHRKDNIITLHSINPNGQDFQWHCKEQPGFIQWMFPVIEIIIRPRDRRWAKTIMGLQ